MIRFWHPSILALVAWAAFQFAGLAANSFAGEDDAFGATTGCDRWLKGADNDLIFLNSAKTGGALTRAQAARLNARGWLTKEGDQITDQGIFALRSAKSQMFWFDHKMIQLLRRLNFEPGNAVSAAKLDQSMGEGEWLEGSWLVWWAPRYWTWSGFQSGVTHLQGMGLIEVSAGSEIWDARISITNRGRVVAQSLRSTDRLSAADINALTYLDVAVVTQTAGRDIGRRLQMSEGPHYGGYGTLYSGLGRLTEAGLIDVTDTFDADGRVRLYEITSRGRRFIRSLNP